MEFMFQYDNDELIIVKTKIKKFLWFVYEKKEYIKPVKVLGDHYLFVVDGEKYEVYIDRENDKHLKGLNDLARCHFGCDEKFMKNEIKKHQDDLDRYAWYGNLEVKQN